MRTVITITAAMALTGCEFHDVEIADRYQSDFHYTYALQPNGRVNAESFNGAIEISGWDENKVEIYGTKFGSSEALRDAVKIETHNGPNALEIRAIKPSAQIGSSGARFTLHVPRRAALDRIATTNGPIKIRDVGAAGHLKSSNGSIQVSNAGGDLDAHTSNGAVEVEAIQGNAALKTSNGRIRVEGVGGTLEAETSHQSITARLDKTPSTTTKLVTSDGAIDLTMTMPPRADVRAETRNNSITVRLPSNTSARLVADTSNGSIASDFGIEPGSGGGIEKKQKKRHVDGTIGDGGPTIQLSTNNGSIRILKGNGNY